jgi:hypothetical protein
MVGDASEDVTGDLDALADDQGKSVWPALIT